MSRKYNKPKLMMLSLMAFVIAVSGCTQGGAPASGNGVSILSWDSDFKHVESGEKVILSLKIKNSGETEAKNVKASIFGIDASEWQAFDIEKNLFSLLGADPLAGSSGAEKTEFFELRAPRLAKGILQSYNPQIRVSYEYSTAASKKITLVGENELRRLIQQGKSLSSSGTTYTSGPLSVDVVTGNFVKTSSTTTKKFPLTIKVRNVGGGYVSRQSFAGSDSDNLVSMELKMPTGLSIEGSSQCSSGSTVVTLFKGQAADITCDVSVLDSGIVSEERTIAATFGYNYYTDASTALSVKGTEETFVTPPVGR